MNNKTAFVTCVVAERKQKLILGHLESEKSLIDYNFGLIYMLPTVIIEKWCTTIKFLQHMPWRNLLDGTN
jgi:hypothetical protein